MGGFDRLRVMMSVFVCAEECVGEVKTALVPIAAGSGGAVAR